MRRTAHRTLLQSFRFWFVLLSVFALAAAWKLDLFGNRRGLQPTPKLASETLPEPEDDVEAVAMLSDVSSGVSSPAPEPIDFHGLAPAPLPPRETPRPRNAAPLASKPAAAPAAVSAKNPFGPANPEFVAIPADSPTLFKNVAGVQESPSTSSSTDAQAADNRAAAFERSQPRRTAGLEATPPDLTTPRPLPSEVAARRRAEPEFTADDRFQQVSNSQSANRPSDVERANVASTGGPRFALPAGSKVDLTSVQKLIESGDDIEAHRIMSEWYWKEPQSRPAFQEQLEQLARRIYLQPQPHYMDPHVVASGQMLATIGKEYGVPWQYLAKLNRTDARRIKPGQKLKVIKGPFSAVVDLSDFELTIHAHGYFVKRYTVGIGRDNSSPYGAFKVQDKLTDPTYYGPTAVVEHDDPENPLGEHWISIGDSFGIHGTIDPNSIGKAESEGCIRLRNEDVAEVYDFLSIGSDVVIRP